MLGAGGNNPTNPTGVALHEEFARTSAALGIEFQFGPSLLAGVDVSLAWLKSVDVDAIYIASNPALLANRERFTAVAADRALPLICDEEAWVAAGALISYSEDITDIWDKSAGYIDRILRGANPADLPVQQATKFRLVIGSAPRVRGALFREPPETTSKFTCQSAHQG